MLPHDPLERRVAFTLACIAACLMIAALGWLFGLALDDEAANWRRLLMELFATLTRIGFP